MLGGRYLEPEEVLVFVGLEPEDVDVGFEVGEFSVGGEDDEVDLGGGGVGGFPGDVLLVLEPEDGEGAQGGEGGHFAGDRVVVEAAGGRGEHVGVVVGYYYKIRLLRGRKDGGGRRSENLELKREEGRDFEKKEMMK